MNVLTKQFPKIGDKIDQFEKVFGENMDAAESMLARFNVNINQSGYLLTLKYSDVVYNIAWSLPLDILETKNVAMKFLPIDAKLVDSREDIVNPFINADDPISIYEFYSESLLETEGFVSNEADKGYITLYVTEYDNGKSSFTVALGREEFLRDQ
jgi:hypothetical protein